MENRPCDMQNFDLRLLICSKVQHNYVQKHIFFPGSFFCSANVQHDTEFLSPNNEFFSANNMYPVIFDLWLLHVVAQGLTVV